MKTITITVTATTTTSIVAATARPVQQLSNNTVIEKKMDWSMYQEASIANSKM